MSPGLNKIYTAVFGNVIDRLALVNGLNNAGYKIRLEDIIYEPAKSERVLIRFQNGHLGKAAVNALQGFTLNGKKLWASGASKEYQIDAYDSRGPTPQDQNPGAADIQRCVTEASVKPVRKSEGKAIKSPIAEEAGISNNDDDEDSGEDSVEEQDDDMAESQDEELDEAQEQDLAENQGKVQDEEPSDDSGSSTEEETSDSE